MKDQEPRDLRLARRAYEAFHDEQPPVWFEDLSHDYQMKWVRAVRASREELKHLPKVGRPNGVKAARLQVFHSVEDAKAVLAEAPRHKGGRINWEIMSPSDRVRVRRAQKYVGNRRYRINQESK